MSDLSNIRAALEATVQRLAQHPDVYGRNEAAVREQLVLPLLRALGWDTENPDEVHPEERSPTGSADFTLRVFARSIVTIEVKKGEVDIAEPGALEQAHRYASASGIKLCVATNGSVWVLARSFEEGRDLRGRILWQVLLSEGSIDEVAQKLSLIARANIESIDQLTRLQDRVTEHWEGLLAEPSELVQALVALLRSRLEPEVQALPYASFLEDYVDQRVREILAAPETALSDARLVEGESEGGSGESVRRGSAASLLVEAAERAIREGRLRPDDQIATGHARYLVSPKSVHRNGRQFFSSRRLSNGLFIETHCAVNAARAHAETLDGWNESRSGRRRGR